MIIVEESFTIIDDDMDTYYNKIMYGILNNNYGIGEKINIIKNETPNYIEVYGYDVYTGEGLASIQKTREKIVRIWLTLKNSSIIVKVQIESLRWKGKNSHIITDQDMYFPMIIDKMSRDLTGDISQELSKRLYPRNTGEILRAEKYGILFFILGVLILPLVLSDVRFLFLVFVFIISDVFYLVYRIRK